jgi:hypothetical protein
VHQLEEQEAENEQEKPEQQTARKAEQHPEHAEHDLEQEHATPPSRVSSRRQFAMVAN